MPQIRIFLLGHMHTNPGLGKYMLNYIKQWKQAKHPKRRIILAEEEPADVSLKERMQGLHEWLEKGGELRKLQQLVKNNNGLEEHQKKQFLNTIKGKSVTPENIENLYNILKENNPDASAFPMAARLWSDHLDMYHARKAMLELLFSLGNDIPYVTIDHSKKEKLQMEAQIQFMGMLALENWESHRLETMRKNIIKALKTKDNQGCDIDVFVLLGMAHTHNLSGELYAFCNIDPELLDNDIRIFPIHMFLNPTYFYENEAYFSHSLKICTADFSNMYTRLCATVNAGMREHYRIYPVLTFNFVQDPNTHQFECVALDQLVAGTSVLAIDPQESIVPEIGFKANVNSFLEEMKKRYSENNVEKKLIEDFHIIFNDEKYNAEKDYLTASREAFRKMVENAKNSNGSITASLNVFLNDFKLGLQYHMHQYRVNKAKEKARQLRIAQAKQVQHDNRLKLTLNWAKIAFSLADQRVNSKRPPQLCQSNLIFTDAILYMAGLKPIKERGISIQGEGPPASFSLERTNGGPA
jgi:hypothetical protein